MTEHSYVDTAVGIGAGLAVKESAQKLLKKPYRAYLNKYHKNFFNDANNQIYKDKGFEAFGKSGLASKHVGIIDINPANYEAEHAKLYLDSERNLEDFKKAAEGKKAFYSPLDKRVVVNMDKRAHSIFHEMGHAVNHTGGGWGKALSTTRMFSKPVAFTILGLGLLGDKDSFFNENCGKLTFLACTPIIAEEALASKNGRQMAKSLLNKDLFSKLRAINYRNLGSYISAAIAASIAASLAVMVKNKIAEAD